MRYQRFLPAGPGSSPRRLALVLIIIVFVVCCGSRHLSYAQPFGSGSTGADGALVLTTPGTVIFDPRSFTPPLDPEGDNIYHFTSITIGAGVTVRLLSTHVNGPVFWLVSGPVQINGIIDLNGESGHDIPTTLDGRRLSVPGSGGYPGGIGRYGNSPAQAGHGPGGGTFRPNDTRFGGGGGHATAGSNGDPSGGLTYGNAFQVPLLGGSGGAGSNAGVANNPPGPGGGAGGGALLIASSVSIVVNGSILANGGAGGGLPGNGTFLTGGGCGAGGAIHLLAPTIGGTGLLSASGFCARPNTTYLGQGGQGRIRLEAFQRTFTGSSDPVPLFVSPYAVVLPPTPPPSVRVVSVAGIPVASTPTGSFTMPDVKLNTVAAVPVVIEARYVPPKTIVKLFLASENGADQTVDSDPLAGELVLSTATASVVPPPGFSWGYVRAVWTP